jgi:hypothetical protein
MFGNRKTNANGWRLVGARCYGRRGHTLVERGELFKRGRNSFETEELLQTSESRDGTALMRALARYEGNEA